MDAQHDRLGNPTASVAVIPPFHDAGLSIEHAVDCLAMHVPQGCDFRCGIVPLLSHVGRLLDFAFQFSPRHCTLRAASSLIPIRPQVSHS